jgi:hypothetical protein
MLCLENRTVCKYRTTIPPIAEPNPNRKLDAPRLRELRKKLDNSHTSAKEVQAIAEECLDDIVELSSGKVISSVQPGWQVHIINLLPLVNQTISVIPLYKSFLNVVQKLPSWKCSSPLHRIWQRLESIRMEHGQRKR